MNEQLFSALRIMMISAGVSLATKFGIDQSLVPTIVAGLFAFATACWSLYTRRHAGLVASAATVPGTTIVTTPDIAAVTPPNVKSNAVSQVVSK
jgi:hypothetical protein